MDKASYERWYRYEREVHAATLAAFETVPQDARSDPDYQRALDLLGHVAAARRLWLNRFGVLPEGPADLFPQGCTLAELAGELERTEKVWSEYLAELTPEEVGRDFRYDDLKGNPYENSVADILTQLFGHSWYHRGQIAQLVRRLGGKPAVTDFVYWARRKLS